MHSNTGYIFAEAQVSPKARLQGIALNRVRWADGFWKRWFDTCRDAMVPTMWQILDDDELSHAFANFRIAAGEESGDHKGPPFFDGDLYKWLEAAISVYALEPTDDMAKLISRVVDMIGRSQRADGYIHTPVVIAEMHENAGHPDADEQELRDHLNFEMYNMGHLMTTACLHRAVIGEETLFQTAVKACEFLEHTFRNPTADLARHSICPSHFMGLADMYRVTGDEKYLQLFTLLFNMRDLRENGQDQNQDRIPFRQQRKAIGHAVRATYLYAGAADLFAETGEPALMEALESIWDNLVEEKIYITGGCGAIYDGASPAGDADHHAMQLIHQAFGREYQLPNLTAYNETCADIGNMLWNWRMFRITGECRYADMVELSVINSVLCGISLDGCRYFYTNALERSVDLPFPLRWSPKREPYITSFCCPPNAVRTVAQTSRYVYAVSDHAIWTVLYGACQAEIELPGSGTVKLRQETDYPWSGEISLYIDEAPGDEFSLDLRIPAWAETASISVNGEALESRCKPGTYVEVRRVWEAGDVARLDVPMEARLMEAHPLVEEDRNRVAVVRGPVVYCIESADLPDGASVHDLHISPETILSPKAGDGVLENMVVLEGTADLLHSDRWDRTLYRPVSKREFRSAAVTLIPYFAWDNRGDGEMAVWHRLK
jgi:uncharacterized protein